MTWNKRPTAPWERLMSDNKVIVATEWAQPPAQRMTTPDDLLSLALSQGADLDRLERLMNLKREYEKDEARKAFAVAMAAFKAEQITIQKDKLVDHRGGRYHHATLGNVVAIVSEALGRHGLYHAWAIKQEPDGVHVKCTLTHQLGHSESVAMWGPPDNSGSKNLIQQIASTVTYLERYTLMAITGVAASDQDDDAGTTAGPTDLLAVIQAATTLDELKALKPRIGALADPADRQACVDAYAKRQEALAV